MMNDDEIVENKQDGEIILLLLIVVPKTKISQLIFSKKVYHWIL